MKSIKLNSIIDTFNVVGRGTVIVVDQSYRNKFQLNDEIEYDNKTFVIHGIESTSTQNHPIGLIVKEKK